MKKRGKWIKGASPEQPVCVVAQSALKQRLRTVWRFAPLAAKKYKSDVEYVHQLRVWTRRAKSALEIFSDLLPERPTKRMNQNLRALRKAAGAARDLDVLGERLRKIAKEKHDDRLEAVVRHVARRRKQAQKPLRSAYAKLKKRKFKEASRVLAQSCRWTGNLAEPTFAETARTELMPMVDVFFEAAKADLSNIESLHQMRIAGKQLRYGLELFAPAIDGFEGLYETFEEVQEKLGDVNDHATAIVTFTDWQLRSRRKKSRAALAELIEAENEALDATQREFHSWWSADRAAALEEKFDVNLKLATPSPHSAAPENGSERKEEFSRS